MNQMNKNKQLKKNINNPKMNETVKCNWCDHVGLGKNLPRHTQRKKQKIKGSWFVGKVFLGKKIWNFY